MDCCGIDKPDDWYSRTNSHKLPPSCCKVINLEEASDCTAKHAHPVGCITRLKKVIDDNSMMLGIVVLVIFSIQVRGNLVLVLHSQLFVLIYSELGRWLLL